MKKSKRNEKNITIVGVIVILVMLFYKMNLFNYYSSPRYFEGAYRIEKNKIDTLNEEIQLVKKTLDSLKIEKDSCVTGRSSYSGFTFGFIGVGIGELTYMSKKMEKVFEEDCIYLSAVNLDLCDDVGPRYLGYYTKNGAGYLLTMKGEKEKDFTRFVYQQKKMGYKYSPEENEIYIPLKSSFWKWTMQVIGVLLFLFFVLLQLYAIRNFFMFLLAIARNETFNLKNVNRLRNISMAIFISCLVPVVVALVIYLVFVLTFSSEGIIFKYPGAFDWYIVVAIFFYVMYIAFKRGMHIEEENKMTI